MADLFGGPLGDIAYHKNALTKMQTAAAEADTSLTPARERLLEAQASSAEALAAGRTAETGLLNASSAADLAYRKDRASKDRLEAMSIMGPMATGRQLTVADRPDDVDAPSNPQLDQAAWLRENGYPHAIWGPMQDQGIDNLGKERMGEYREAQANKQNIEAQIKQQEERGEIASDAGSSELSWLHATQDPYMRQRLPKQILGMSYERAKPHLDVIARAATSKVEEDKAKLEEIKESRAAALAADQKIYYASLRDKAKAQTDIYKDTLERVRQNDGYKSKGAKDAAESLTESRKILAAMNKLAAFPAVPLSVDELIVGNGYTGANGDLVIWLGEDEAGDPTWARADPAEAARRITEAQKDEDEPWEDLL